jgi:signal transduction histidine kinase
VGNQRTDVVGRERPADRLNALVALQSARIARTLHDDTSQVLASAHCAIEDVTQDLPEPLQARLHRVRKHLHDVAEQLRRISHELHPGILDDVGIVDAITFSGRLFTRRTGVQLALALRLDEPLPAPVAAVVYRFVQEALANISAHARAGSASIAIGYMGTQIECTVSDDGVGFDVAGAQAADSGRLGLMLLRARLEAVGGTLHVTSFPGQGTCLRAAIPLET